MTTRKVGPEADERVAREAMILERDPGPNVRVAVACDWCGMLSLSGPSCEWCGSPFKDEDLERMARNAIDVAAALREMEGRLERELLRAGAERRHAEEDRARRAAAERELLELESEDVRAAEVADRLAAAAARRGEAAREAVARPASFPRATGVPRPPLQEGSVQGRTSPRSPP
jgi:hypothetical protein